MFNSYLATQFSGYKMYVLYHCSLAENHMSDGNSSWKSVAVNTAIAATAFATGALIDEVIKSKTNKPSEAGKLAAVGLLASLHLGEASDILGKWTNGDNV